MAYELEFIGVNEETQDATAICMRWQNADGTYSIGIFDGGLKAHGTELANHLNKYYFSADDDKNIDFVICSHPHQDHASGLAEILENFQIKALYMNRPWNHTDILYDKVKDGRTTPKTLAEKLKEKYCYIATLETIAFEKQIPVYDIFEGDIIAEKLQVLSPSKDFYLELLVESDKTPLEAVLEKAVEFIKKVINKIQENWNEESLREDVKTEPDNETSIVVLGEMTEESFLLTGDVGIRGLQKAIDYSNLIAKPIKDTVTIYEIPHHGGRHNVSPTILNQLLGDIVEEGTEINKKAFVCTGKNSDHPHQMVVNAFKRRGVKVFNASGATIFHHLNMPKREGWSSVTSLEFNPQVEDWD